jgi:hypothetical protein
MAKSSPEQEKRYQTVKQFKGVNTKSDRTAIDDEEFAWLENMMPIGFGNMKSVPDFVNVQVVGGGNVAFSNVVTNLQAINIQGIDYIIATEQNGGAEYYALQTQIQGNVCIAGTFSGANTFITQWKDERAIIVDPSNGYFSYDGNNVVIIGSLGSFGITNPGKGYTDTPGVTISPPDDPNGVQATATASISANAGTVQSLTVTTPGQGYQWVPNVTISAPILPSGTQAVATATILAGAVVALNLVSPGSGYASNATVTISGGGNSIVNVATGAVIVNTGSVTGISPSNPGTGYKKPPTIMLVGGTPTNVATAQAGIINFSTGTVAGLVQMGGQGYTNPANIVVTISGGNGINAATAVATIQGDQIGSLVMTNSGKGYTVPPNIMISGGGGSNATAIAVVTTSAPGVPATFSGRVWIPQGRVMFFTAADSYNDFASVSAGNLEITDTTLHSNIKGTLSANNFLYIFGDDSINVFSDVRVQTDGSTIFTNTNVSASVGSRYPSSVFPYYRTIMFQNDYGMFALVGATTTKLSDALDGIVPLIDFSKPVTAGQVLINNVLCAVFSFTYNDPVAGDRPLQAVFFEKKWYFTSQGSALKYVVNVPFNGKQNLYGTDGISLFQLYGNASSAALNTKTQSALWALGDPIRDKQALKFGVEATLTTATGMFVSVDSEISSSPLYTFVNAATWTDNAGGVSIWTLPSGAPATWLRNQAYALYKSDAQQLGKYIGLTVTSNSGGMTINTLELEHELRARF